MKQAETTITEKTMNVKDKLGELRMLIPPLQYKALAEYLDGEEKTYFEGVVDELHTSLSGMRAGEKELFFFHYFGPSGDWWMMELDEDSLIGYGYARLSGMSECAEFGSFSLQELFTSAPLINIEYAPPVEIEKITEA